MDVVSTVCVMTITSLRRTTVQVEVSLMGEEDEPGPKERRHTYTTQCFLRRRGGERMPCAALPLPFPFVFASASALGPASPVLPFALALAVALVPSAPAEAAALSAAMDGP